MKVLKKIIKNSSFYQQSLSSSDSNFPKYKRKCCKTRFSATTGIQPRFSPTGTKYLYFLQFSKKGYGFYENLRY